MKQIRRFSAAFTLYVGLAVILALVPGRIATAQAAPSSYLVAAARASEPVGTQGETFFTADISVTTPDGNITVAGNSDGTGSFWVDDILEFDITHPDGTTSVYRADDSNGCTASTVLTTPATSLSSYFEPGTNNVHVTFRDACGGNGGNSEIYLVGNASFSSGTSTIVTTPSYTVVRYLQQISVPSCIANLLGAKIAAAGILCTFLANSANTYPPDDLSGAALDDFIAKKQYRQYVNYPSYSVTCAGGTIRDISSTSTSAPFSWSLGYTRVQGPRKTNYFSLGEPYTENNNFDRTSPDETYYAGKSSVEIVFQDASRLATAERVGNYALTGLDAPFIWTDVIEDINCNGTYGLTVATDTVPSTDIYINGHEASYDKQSSNLGAFLKEGGNILNPVGYGNLAYPCHIKHFNAQGQLDDSFTGCVPGFQGFQGGQSDGGGASGSW